MSSVETFPLIELSGGPYQRGQQHGAAVPERVRGSINLYRDQLQRRGVDQDTLKTLARNMIPLIKAYDEAYLEEMRGIADGAGVALEDIIVVNCRTEMMFGHSQLQEARTALDDGCTALIVLPEASATGRLMHAHNWDWRDECADTGVVLRVLRDDGPDMLLFTEAGTLGRHGFNSAGVSLCGNFLSSDRDYKTQAEVPLALVRRKMLDAPNMAAALRTIFNSKRFTSNNLMLAHMEGEAVNLECAPDEIFWITPEDGILVHANHWLSPTAQAKLVDLSLPYVPDTIYRQRRVAARLHGVLRAGGKIDWDVVKAALGDEFGKPESVLSWPSQASYSSISVTVATTLMDPAAKTMWIARKPYEGRNFVEYHL